jgi:hypothetical protein
LKIKLTPTEPTLIRIAHAKLSEVTLAEHDQYDRNCDSAAVVSGFLGAAAATLAGAGNGLAGLLNTFSGGAKKSDTPAAPKGNGGMAATGGGVAPKAGAPPKGTPPKGGAKGATPKAGGSPAVVGVIFDSL